MNDSHFDADQIGQLRKLRQGVLLPRLLIAYKEQAHELLHAMEKAASDGDLPGIRSAAHTLKSASTSLGATRMGVLSARIEHAARAHQGSEVTELIAGLRVCYLAMLPAIDALLNG